MQLPKLIILDRDGTLNIGAEPSDDFKSPFFYILDPTHLIIKPKVQEALNILKVFNVPTILATKQRCIGYGLISRERVAIINSRLERVTNFDFEQIYVEEEHGTKYNLYIKILKEYPKINPQSIWLFDDSETERAMAAKLGITTFDGNNLYDSIVKQFKLK